MQQKINDMKNFFRVKNGYLSIGNTKLQNILYKKFNVLFSIEDIKEVKKEVKKEYAEFIKEMKSKNFSNNKPVINTVGREMTIEPSLKNKEIVDQLALLASQLGMQVVSNDSIPSEPKSIVRKKPLRSPFVTPEIKDQVGMHLLMGCQHVPFHHAGLHSSVINLLKDRGQEFKGLHLMGDFLDINPLSSHDKGRFTVIPGLTLDDEYAVGNEVLDDYMRYLPKDTWKTYLYGNHEDRYNRWMSVMDNAKTPLESPESGLRLKQRGFGTKTNWKEDYVLLGTRFQLFHGIYFSIHNAKAHLDKLKTSCAYVHTHRIQNYREGKMSAYNIGTGANTKHKVFGYASRAMKESWANGFAIAVVDELGEVHMTQIVPDANGSFYFGGKKY